MSGKKSKFNGGIEPGSFSSNPILRVQRGRDPDADLLASIKAMSAAEFRKFKNKEGNEAAINAALARKASSSNGE